MFLQVSVIHSVHRGGGYLPQCMLGYPPRPGRPPGADPPWTRQTPPPWEQTHQPPGPDRPPQSRPPPRADTPLRSRHTTTTTTPQTRETLPPEQPPPPRTRQTPPREADSSIRSTSGRFASYWNAFLLGSAVGDLELFLK